METLSTSSDTRLGRSQGDATRFATGEKKATLRKRRRRAAWFVMRLANAFFRIARNPVEAIANDDEWRKWEVDCFRMLHAPEFDAVLDPTGVPSVSLLPGRDLAQHLTEGTLRPDHLRAAGVELKRAHFFHSAYYDGGWSHGDSHTGNFVFQAETDHARLVDFEMRHHRELPEARRHADDLLVMLQDVCGRCERGAWLPLAMAFLDGYGRGEIIALLPPLLRVPHGIPRIWWGVRTTWMRRSELERRMAELRGVLVQTHTPQIEADFPST